MIIGAAPISAQILDFMKVALSCQIRETYGLTEVSAGVFLTPESDPISGNVGIPNPTFEYKLVDIREMEYYSSGDRP
jgi:long-chain acyl-CoA synthetase